MADIDYDAMIAGYYQEMELDIIASMKRNLSRHIKDEEDVGFEFPQWQAMKLKELKRYQRQNQRIIAGVGNKVSKKVSEHMLGELAQGSKKEMKRYKDIMGDSYQSSVLMKDSFFRINDRKVNALIDALTNDLSDANYAALRMVNDTYRDVIFKASFFAANGVKTPKQAIDMATRDFLERGINCIEYKNGRRVNIASYAQMAVRTAGKRANLMGEGERRHALGVPFVKISRHGTSCKLCKPFEGKVLIDDVYSGGTASDGKYMLLSQAMAQGLFHPNCRHGCSTHDPRDDDDDYDEPQLEDSQSQALKEEYTHAQRMVQKYKRLSAGSLDPENVARYSEKLREWEERKAQIKDKMSKLSGNDWSETVPREISQSEKEEIISYAKSKGVNIVDLSRFDGDPELLIEQIDTIARWKEMLPVKRRVTLKPGFIDGDDDFGAVSNRTIEIQTKALRNRQITNNNINIDPLQFASSDVSDLAAHEYGHIFVRENGINSIEILKEAYYNIYGMRPTDKEINDYLECNISLYSVSNVKRESISEIFAKHNSNPTAYTKEVIRLLTKKVAL